MSSELNDPDNPQPPLEVADAPYPSLDELAQLLPQYEVHEIVGVGGMGAVYKARQMALDRWVAIKVLPTTASQNSEDTQRFIKEARAMAKLVHPNIVAVFDFGQTYARHLFLVMEYVEGMDLHLRTRAGEITPQRAREVIAQLCDALQFAHDHGVAHRDIKPANILITNDWKVKVADFGLARDLLEQANPDEPEYGTPDYTAPERLIVGAVVDHRADIYSLGVVIHEILTGKTPTVAGKETGKGLPDGFARVITKCLTSEPEGRYQKASEVKIALLTATAEKAQQTSRLKQEPSVSSEPHFIRASYEPFLGGRAKRFLSPVAWGLGCVLLVGAFGWFTLKDKISFEPATPTSAEIPAPEKPVPAALVPAAPAPEVVVVPPPMPMPAPKVIEVMADPIIPDLSAESAYTVSDGLPGEVARLHGHSSSIHEIEMLADGKCVLSASHDGTLRLWHLATQKEIYKVDVGIAQLSGMQVHANDSDAMVYSYYSDQLAMVDLKRGKVTHTASFPDKRLSRALYISGAKSVLVAGSHDDGTQNLFLWKPEISDELVPVPNYTGGIYSMIANPDQRSAIVNGSQIIDVEKRSSNPYMMTYSTETGELTPMPESAVNFLFTYHQVRGANQIFVNAKGPKIVSLPDLRVLLALPTILKGEPTFTSGLLVDDGKKLLTSWTDKTLRVYEVTKGEEVWRQSTPEIVTDIAMSQDQRSAILSTRAPNTIEQEADCDLIIWRLPIWTELRTPESREIIIARQMEDLAKYDPELATLRQTLRSTYPMADPAALAAQKQTLNAQYVAAVRRQIPGLAPTEQNSLKQEVERVALDNPLPAVGMDSALPPVLQKLRRIYRQQITTTQDQEKQSRDKNSQLAQASLKPLLVARESRGDATGAGRVTAVMKDWPVVAQQRAETPTPTAAPTTTNFAAGTPTQRPKRAGTVISIQRSQKNSTDSIRLAEVSKIPTDLGPVVDIAGGSNHIIALLPDGKLRIWGDAAGLLEAVPDAAKDVVQIDSTEDSAVALCSDGTVIAWRPATADDSPVILKLTDGKAPLSVHAGSEGTGLILCTDGSIQQISPQPPALPANLGPVAKLIFCHSTDGWCAIQRDGRPVYWGDLLAPVTPIPPDMRDIITVCIERDYAVALQRDGTMTGWGQLAQNQRFRIRKFTGGSEVLHDYGGRVFAVHRNDDSWELATNPGVPEYVAEDRTSVVEGRMRGCIDAILTRDYVIALKP